MRTLTFASLVAVIVFFLSPSLKASRPLPIALDYFTAEYIGGLVEVTWRTSTEYNNDYIQLLKSEDSVTFNVVAVFDGGSGHSTDTVLYSFMDSLVEPGKVYYYKLRQYDFDGSFEDFAPKRVTTTVSVLNPVEIRQLICYPNPATDQLMVSGESFPTAVTGFALLDQLGRRVSVPMVWDGNALHVDVSHLSKGIYECIFEMRDGNRGRARFVKQ